MFGLAGVTAWVPSRAKLSNSEVDKRSEVQFRAAELPGYSGPVRPASGLGWCEARLLQVRIPSLHNDHYGGLVLIIEWDGEERKSTGSKAQFQAEVRLRQFARQLRKSRFCYDAAASPYL